jgi:hypothetical protein
VEFCISIDVRADHARSSRCFATHPDAVIFILVDDVETRACAALVSRDCNGRAVDSLPKFPERAAAM